MYAFVLSSKLSQISKVYVVWSNLQNNQHMSQLIITNFVQILKTEQICLMWNQLKGYLNFPLNDLKANEEEILLPSNHLLVPIRFANILANYNFDEN